MFNKNRVVFPAVICLKKGIAYLAGRMFGSCKLFLYSFLFLSMPGKALYLHTAGSNFFMRREVPNCKGENDA
jgi:hypothetical protein